jgi:hypothetical protein
MKNARYPISSTKNLTVRSMSLPVWFLLAWAVLWTSPLQAADIWVSTQGSDSNSGTEQQPKATLQAALRQARDLRRLKDASVKGGINICLLGGTYELAEPVFLRPEDSGTENSPTTIKAVSGEIPVLSGGMKVKGWKKAKNTPGLPATAVGKVYATDAPQIGGNLLEYRQLWVNGRKAVRARDANDDNLPRITSWDKKTGTLGIPSEWAKRYPVSSNNAASVELVLHQMWAIANLRIRSVQEHEGEMLLTFQQPEARIQAEHPWPTPMTVDSLRSPFYRTNALEFLDQPGEWFLDTDAGKLYYWPRQGENLKTAEVVVPRLEIIVKVSGTLDAPVRWVRFESVTFAYTTWMRPSLQGHVPLQAGMYMLDAYRLRPPGTPENPNKGLDNQAWLGRPSASVWLQGVQHTSFLHCRFLHLGGSGLDYEDGTYQDRVQSCLFSDIGSNGIQCGRFNLPGMEAHLPYNPIDERELCTALTISNNLITNVTNDDWGTEGIAAGYVRGIRIEHNEVSEVSYMGITVGWGWQKANNCMRENIVKANYIHHYAKHMYDVSGIYTLSVQPKSQVIENVVDSIYHPAYVHDPNHWFYLYTDEGSSFMTVRDNWCPTEKFLQNANGPGVTWENNGPMVADSIRSRAGLEPEFRRKIHAAYNRISAPGIENKKWRPF